MIDFLVNSACNLRKYFSNGIEITICIKENKRTLFKINKYIISIFLEIDGEISNNIENVCDVLIKNFDEESRSFRGISIIANWYIYNNVIDKNGFYKINTQDKINYRNMFNTFLLINKETGEVFFNPEKIENKVISERMVFLQSEYDPSNEEKKTIFSREISHLYDVMEVVLGNVNGFKYTRKIKNET